MTTTCWKEDPNSRPTVDDLLEALRNAAEQWESKRRKLAAQSPGDDYSPTLGEEADTPTVSEHGEEPGSPTVSEHGDEPVAPASLSNTLRTTINAKLSTPDAQLQSTHSTRRSPDEVVERVLVRAKSPLGKDEVRTVVESLEKVSRKRLLPTDPCAQPVDDSCSGPSTK
jgi:hypothetical protein